MRGKQTSLPDKTIRRAANQLRAAGKVSEAKRLERALPAQNNRKETTNAQS